MQNNAPVWDVLPKRKGNRLKCYDYRQEGLYFITICTHDRKDSDRSIGFVVGAFKASVTKRIREMEQASHASPLRVPEMEQASRASPLRVIWL